MSFCYKKILGVFTHLRVTTPNIIEPFFVFLGTTMGTSFLNQLFILYFLLLLIVVQIFHKWIDQRCLVYSHRLLLFLYQNG